MALNIFSIIKKRSNAHTFYIPRLSNDMKMAIQKNHLAGKTL